MQSEWSALLERRFTPAEAERITGVSVTLQRKWVQLHFSVISDGAWQWKGESERGHRRFTWAGIQMLEFFKDVSRDLGSDHGQRKFAKSDNEFGDSDQALYRSDLFEVDFRFYEHGDMFLCRSLTDGGPTHFLTATSAGVASLISDRRGERLYLYNLSAMQRELVSRVLGDNPVPTTTSTPVVVDSNV